MQLRGRRVSVQPSDRPRWEESLLLEQTSPALRSRWCLSDSEASSTSSTSSAHIPCASCGGRLSPVGVGPALSLETPQRSASVFIESSDILHPVCCLLINHTLASDLPASLQPASSHRPRSVTSPTSAVMWPNVIQASFYIRCVPVTFIHKT